MFLTGADGCFHTLLHVLNVLSAGLVGMVMLHGGLAFECQKRRVHPKKTVTIMKVWAGLFAFVGIQMARNRQPFVGDLGPTFQSEQNLGRLRGIDAPTCDWQTTPSGYIPEGMTRLVFRDLSGL